ncbi:MAG: tRNA (adenosine(37)-N6)-threonylcarbamoyltransferase complex ATPase subunit type 1 TsaE [Candidatus Edwardsbacteria bacterium]|nr:tRNA (adenosine(37)-N6)-threonylcarbamoyltransferase complex ATPase subunit type 1 TsaE [Candidatus Edwardsbacteria bacterium]
MSRDKIDHPVTTSSPEETQAIGRRLSAFLAAGDVVCLWGDLGAGKTCLVQGICRGLEVRESVVSPSFTLINEYSGKYPVAHIDFYRLKGEVDLEQLGFDDLLDGKRIVLIEWPERAAGALPADRVDIHLRWISDNQREIKLITYLNKITQLIDK